MTPPPRTPFSKEPATERAAAPLGTMATPATAGRRGAKVHQTGDERPPTASHPPPRTASQGQMRGSNSCPPGRGLRAAVTLVHTSRNTRALWVSSLCHLGHSLCTHVQVHVHTAEAPRAPDRSPADAVACFFRSFIISFYCELIFTRDCFFCGNCSGWKCPYKVGRSKFLSWLFIGFYVNF